MSSPPPPTKKKGSPLSNDNSNEPNSGVSSREVRPEIPEHRWENEEPTTTPSQEDPFSSPPPNLDGMDFVAPPNDPDAETIAGHEVHHVTHKEMMQQHYEETGGAPLWGGSMEPNEEAMQQARRAQQKGVLDEEVDQLTPQWMRDRQQSSPPQSTQTPAQRDMTQTAMPEVDVGDMKSAADAIRLLNQQAAQAEADGNIVGARALREAMENFAASTELTRKYVAQEPHPVLTKLKSSLGLEKIRPAVKKWAGISWNCYPSNMVLDSWFFDNLWDDRRNFSPLKIATYCVGLDGVPLYEVFGVPLVHEYQTVDEDGKIHEVKLKPYRKYCKSCGYEVELLSHDKCKNCGASLDPFVTPLALRLFCAEKLYTFFQEDFGPTEKLDNLVGILRDVIKDRIVDGEELFPLAMLSVKAPTTDGSPSGEDQLQEPESSPQIQEQ